MSLKVAVRYLIDLFYPIFRPVLDHQTYRFLACGGVNVAVEILSFFIAYHFIIQKQVIHLPMGIAISPYIGALIISFCIGFPQGFWMMRNVAFPSSTLRGRTQLVRYFIVVMINLLLNYVLLKILVEQLNIYPTPSKVIATGVVVVTSYLLQKYFSFRTN